MGGQRTSILSYICCNSDNSNIPKWRDFGSDILAKLSETEWSVKFLKPDGVLTFSRGETPQIILEETEDIKQWQDRNMAVFPCHAIKPQESWLPSQPRCWSSQSPLLSGTVRDSAPEKSDRPHSASGTRGEDISVTEKGNDTKAPSITAARQHSLVTLPQDKQI